MKRVGTFFSVAVALLVSGSVFAVVKTSAFRVEGMKNEVAVKRVTEAVKAVRGVQDAVGSASSAILMVRYDNALASGIDLAEAVSNAGYTLSSIEGTPQAGQGTNQKAKAVLTEFALVLGQTTYGKGSVQTLFPLQGGNWLKMTTARWFTPAGRSIQKPYGIGRDTVDDGGDEEGDTATAQQSTAGKPTYKTDSGRTVYGGGGIYPDVVVSPDTLSAAERAFFQGLQQYGSKYFDTRFLFAVDYTREHPQLPRSFTLSPEDMTAFFNLLQQRGVKVTREVFNAAAPLVARDLALLITRDKWGEQARVQRMNAEDPQVRVAADLLQRSPTPQALLVAGQRYAAAHPAPATKTAAATHP